MEFTFLDFCSIILATIIIILTITVAHDETKIYNKQKQDRYSYCPLCEIKLDEN